ncbi:MAG: RNA methyltransferase [Bacteroidota bacterium]
MQEIITSTSNPRIKNLVKLIEKSSEREKQNKIIIEGQREIGLAINSGIYVEMIFVCSDFSKDNNNFFGNIPVTEVSASVFKKISFRENPDGFIAVARPKLFSLSELNLSSNPILIILESVEKPGNLGAILRTADGVGADAVIICDLHTDIFNPNVIRSSQGCVFTQKIVAKDSDEVINWLKEKGIKIFATSPDAKKYYSEANFKGPIAIVMGTEANGLTEKWLSQADKKIKIPMLGKIDSLNVSVSTAIIVYEALRQRAAIRK